MSGDWTPGAGPVDGLPVETGPEASPEKSEAARLHQKLRIQTSAWSRNPAPSISSAAISPLPLVRASWIR
jgi:hypothetical protein